MQGVIIIAEAGVNHNGDLNLAKKLIDAAADAGVDYVKFQTFKAEKLVSKKAKKAEYQIKNSTHKDSDSQLEMLKKLELSKADHFVLIEYCKRKNVKFLSTAFDEESLDFLIELGIELFKVPSGEITNLPFLKKIASQGKKVVVSTGMSSMEEVVEAVSAIQKAGTQKDNITILHCNTQYPTPFEDVNLKAMLTIKKELGIEIGYSDHTNGIEVPIAAVALGARIIEKHFTLDKSLPGPDHKASLNPIELKEMVVSIRNIEKALGSSSKQPSPSEIANKEIARKSIHIHSALKKGHIITEKDLSALRPGTGISPMQIEKVIGRKLIKDVDEEHLLSWEDLE
ncbi:MAG: N-acetylneuraminate synthase [Sphingobacteriaceae bacterium]|nr:N-acetylneuraminate synthase [Sphingobacteriaceae bacterium]